MRTITKHEALPTERRTAIELKPGIWFKWHGSTAWYIRTDDVTFPVVDVASGTLYPAKQACHWAVSEVLGPNESLTIGPEVE